MFYSRATTPYYNDKLLALCQMLCPDDPTLTDEVGLAIERPEAYLAHFHGRQEQGRHIFEPLTILPWLALLDGLIDRGSLVEVDWRAETTAIMHELDGLLPASLRTEDRWNWVDPAAWDEVDTAAFLQAIGERWRTHGFVLGCVFLATDSYPLLILEQERFAAARELAQQTSYGGMIACLPETPM